MKEEFYQSEHFKVTQEYLNKIIPHLRAHEAYDHLKTASMEDRKTKLKEFNETGFLTFNKDIMSKETEINPDTRYTFTRFTKPNHGCGYTKFGKNLNNEERKLVLNNL